MHCETKRHDSDPSCTRVLCCITVTQHESLLKVLPQVVLLFPRQFWPKGADMFGRVAETVADRGEFFLFYSYADLAGA